MFRARLALHTSAFGARGDVHRVELPYSTCTVTSVVEFRGCACTLSRLQSTCPTCGNRFDSATFCPSDGSRLVGSAEIADRVGQVIGDRYRLGLTRTGTFVGTPHYMAPEQALGAKVDARADMCSVGVILYVMFTGTVPFVADWRIAVGVSVGGRFVVTEVFAAHGKHHVSFGLESPEKCFGQAKFDICVGADPESAAAATVCPALNPKRPARDHGH